MAHCLSVYLSAYLWAQRPYPPSILPPTSPTPESTHAMLMAQGHPRTCGQRWYRSLCNHCENLPLHAVEDLQYGGLIRALSGSWCMTTSSNVTIRVLEPGGVCHLESERGHHPGGRVNR